MLVPLRVARKAVTRHSRALRGAAALSLLLCLLAAGTARADSATLNVLNTAGQSDPAAGVPRTFSVTGSSAVPERVYVRYRNPGGAPCAPTPDSDSGDTIDGYYGTFYSHDVNGSFNVSKVLTWDSSGPTMFCIWIAPSSTSSVTPITQVVTFRSPTGTISATLNPINPKPNQTAAVTITGVSEAPEYVYATAHSAAVPCSQNYSADDNLSGTTSVDDGTSVNGSFSLSDSVSESVKGNYVLCLWLADSSSSVTSIAGPQPIPFTVGTPTPTVSPECKKARSTRDKWIRAVTKTKRQLLRAKRRSTRRRLIKQLASQRRHLKTASKNVKVIC